MNEEDEIISVRRLRSVRTSSMSEETSLGLRLVGEPCERTCSHRSRKKIRQGIVWQVAYGVGPTPEGVAVQGEPIGSVFPMRPHTHRYRMTNICPAGANSSRSLVARLIKRRANDDANIARRTGHPKRRLHTPERLLGAGQEPPLAAHVVTSRHGYLHHGIYAGNGTIVHYAGFARGLHRGPVEEVSLADFARGRPAWIRSNAPPKFELEEIIRRARSRIGEDCYRLLSNNCEHFCEWCVRGEHRSYQVEALLMHVRHAFHATMRLAQHIRPCLAAEKNCGYPSSRSYDLYRSRVERSATKSRPVEHRTFTTFA